MKAKPPDDTPRPSPPMTREQKAAIRKAATIRRAIARVEQVRDLCPAGEVLTPERHLGILQAVMEDIFLLQFKPGAGPAQKVEAATAFRKLSSQYARLAGHNMPDQVESRSYSATLNMDAGVGSARAAGERLEAFRREQQARIRDMSAPPGLGQEAEDDGDDDG